MGQSGHSLRVVSWPALRDKTDLGRNRRYDRFRPTADLHLTFKMPHGSMKSGHSARMQQNHVLEGK
jgi:hypothetical protein